MKGLDNSIKNRKKYDFRDAIDYIHKSKPGLNSAIIQEISKIKGEPEWMLEKRLEALKVFESKSVPEWGPDLSELSFDNLYYYLKITEKPQSSWEEVPSELKETFERLGVPQAEREMLAGVSAQYESEVVYHNLQKEWEDKGVIFTDMDTAVRKYPEIVKEYFGTIVPSADNKFSALNTAVWSGGSFVYIPKGVRIDIPLQTYFRINAESLGQFERTLIIADEGSYVHYTEGCTAPIYSKASLHAAVVEIVVRKGARVRYSTVQNWSTSVYNLVTKRSHVYEDGIMEWVDGNLGSKVTMKYPSCVLKEKGAHGEMLSIAMAGEDQHQDTGAKMIHLASDTSSRIISKSISLTGGRSSYRGLVAVAKNAKNIKNEVICDALLLDENSRSDTYPTIRVNNNSAELSHEASVSKIREDQLFYLRSRGLSEEQASSMIVSGFIEPIVKELPMEYAVELNRLIELEMEGSVE